MTATVDELNSFIKLMREENDKKKDIIRKEYENRIYHNIALIRQKLEKELVYINKEIETKHYENKAKALSVIEHNMAMDMLELKRKWASNMIEEHKISFLRSLIVNERKYHESLKSLVSEVFNESSQIEEVVCRESDIGFMKELFRGQSIKISASEDEKLRYGGIIAFSHDGKVAIDNTIITRWNRGLPDLWMAIGVFLDENLSFAPAEETLL